MMWLYVLQVNADWIVPSNRESVDSSSAWNQMLRAAIPELFVRWVHGRPLPTAVVEAWDLPEDSCKEHPLTAPPEGVVVCRGPQHVTVYVTATGK